MALIGYEIIQSRTWVDPHAAPAPKLNHKNVFPITVFDAVRMDMHDENSTTLRQALDNIDNQLMNTQPILPAKPANNLVTYGGVAGQVGSIQITSSISDTSSDNKIPTEHAIAYYVQDTLSKAVIKWDDIVGKPMLTNELGTDEHTIISQKGVTNAINEVDLKVEKLTEVAITQEKPIIEVRPDIDASDDNLNGNLIPDVQWVLNKIEEMLTAHDEAFMKKLETIVPCLMPKPPKTDQTVEGVSATDIAGIVDGTVTADPSEKLNIAGYVMERIPDAIVEAIAEGSTTPDPASRIVVDDIWIEAIDNDTVLGIMDGTVTPTSSVLTVPAELIDSNCDCPCCNS